MANAKNTVCIWYDTGAEEAANFYAATFPDTKVIAITLRHAPLGETRRLPIGADSALRRADAARPLCRHVGASGDQLADESGGRGGKGQRRARPCCTLNHG